MSVVAHTSSPDETRALGARIGALLVAGDVVVLAGDLGAGKTCLTKGIARALEIEDTVVSPTFTVMREYEGRLPLVHVDVYRLDALQELHDIGFDDVVGTEGVAVVEWGDQVGAVLPLDRLHVSVTFGGGAGVDGDDDRTFTFDALGATWHARADALAALADDPAGGGS